MCWSDCETDFMYIYLRFDELISPLFSPALKNTQDSFCCFFFFTSSLLSFIFCRTNPIFAKSSKACKTSNRCLLRKPGHVQGSAGIWPKIRQFRSHTQHSRGQTPLTFPKSPKALRLRCARVGWFAFSLCACSDSGWCSHWHAFFPCM